MNNRAIWTSNYGNKTIVAADVATKDLEAAIVNPILFGRGQMLVLTKKVDTTEAHRLHNLGYGFASVEQVSDHLARSLQIPRDDLENLVGRLHAFSERQLSLPKKGTYIGSFLVQPKPGMRGLDVIVPRAAPGRLPMVKLSSDELDGRQMSIACCESITAQRQTQKMICSSINSATGSWSSSATAQKKRCIVQSFHRNNST